MIVTKVPRNNKYLLIYIGWMSEDVDNTIIDFSKTYDIFVYINKKSRIDPVWYSSLLPISGYEYGNKSPAEFFVDFIKWESSSSLCNTHLLTYIPYFNKSGKCRRELCDSLIMKNLIEYSIFKSSIISFDDRSKKYRIKRNLFTKIFGDKLYGINSSHKCESDMVILCSDFRKMLSVNDSYTRSFKNDRINEFIPSLFNKLDIKFINDDPNNLIK